MKIAQLTNVCMLVNAYDNELYMVMVSAYHFCAKIFFLYKILVLLYILKRSLLQFAQKRSLRMKKMLVLYTSADPE